MINPTDCREFAAQCIELANKSGNGGFQSILFNMAHKWTRIAESREERVPVPVARKEPLAALPLLLMAETQPTTSSTT
jgi:hypothetical protein